VKSIGTETKIVRITLDADELASGVQAGDTSGAGAETVVHDHSALVRVCSDHIFHQCNGFFCGMDRAPLNNPKLQYLLRVSPTRIILTEIGVASVASGHGRMGGVILTGFIFVWCSSRELRIVYGLFSIEYENVFFISHGLLLGV